MANCDRGFVSARRRTTPPLTLASGQSSPTPTFSHDDAVVNQIVGVFFTLMYSMFHIKCLFLCCNLELGIRICVWFHSALQARITAKLCLGLLLDAKGMTYKSSVKCLAVYGRHCMFILFQVDMPFSEWGPCCSLYQSCDLSDTLLFTLNLTFFSWSIFSTNFLMLLVFLFPSCKTLQDKLYSPDLVLNFWHDWHQVAIGDQLTSNLAVNLESRSYWCFPCPFHFFLLLQFTACLFQNRLIAGSTEWLESFNAEGVEWEQINSWLALPTLLHLFS